MRVNCQNIFVTIKATSENMTKEVMSALANKKNLQYRTGMILLAIKALPLKLYFAIKMPPNFLPEELCFYNTIVQRFLIQKTCVFSAER